MVRPSRQLTHTHVPAYAGRNGILLRERFIEDMRVREMTRETAISAYVLLDDVLAGAFHERLSTADFEKTPRVVLACAAERFAFPPSRTIPDDAPFDAYLRFVPARTIALEFY